MAKAKSMDWYIDNNDFEGAYERLETTSLNWKKRWFSVCETIFKNCKELATKYILNPVDCTVKKIQKVITKRETSYADQIQVDEGVDLLNDAEQKCYLFTFFDAENNMVCSKIGTTTRTVRQRLIEELKSNTYKKIGCVRAVVNRVYDCGKLPAEGLESYFRAMYIKKYPDSFKKNDRFMHTWLDLKEADKIVAEYFARGVDKTPLACYNKEKQRREVK